MKKAAPPTIRCAIYTRKSTEEGLEQDFNSLDAQRLAGENFIASQTGEGWICLPERYDDGGYTGGNTERPALKRLLADIAAGRIDCVVVYKVDRLSRSLLDFATVMGLFELHGVAFVSVTQSFNSSNSMGRLTLNILLSFAQFEREVISERTRDKIAMARKKGKWSGGMPVLGYDVAPEGARLLINPAEAEQVRVIFGLYLELQGITAVIDELDRRGWTNKSWVTRKGKLHPPKPFSKNSLHNLLTNPIYLGQVRHHGEVYDGEHDAIVDHDTYATVQTLVSQGHRAPATAVAGQSLLTGLVHCVACDCGMTPAHSKKGQTRYRYYLCQQAKSRGWKHCPQPSLPADDLERFVLDEIRAIGSDPDLIREVVAATGERRETEMAEARQRQRLLRQEIKRLRDDETAIGLNSKEPHRDRTLLAIQEKIQQLEQENGRLCASAASLKHGMLDASSITTACRQFDPLWETLNRREQRRLLSLLIERVDYDAAGETIAITFHPTGIKTLTQELANQEAS